MYTQDNYDPRKHLCMTYSRKQYKAKGLIESIGNKPNTTKNELLNKSLAPSFTFALFNGFWPFSQLLIPCHSASLFSLSLSFIYFPSFSQMLGCPGKLLCWVLEIDKPHNQKLNQKTTKSPKLS